MLRSLQNFSLQESPLQSLSLSLVCPHCLQYLQAVQESLDCYESDSSFYTHLQILGWKSTLSFQKTSFPDSKLVLFFCTKKSEASKFHITATILSFAELMELQDTCLKDLLTLLLVYERAYSGEFKVFQHSEQLQTFIQ